ncbi:MAG: porin, partial [Pseudomonadota bacterium]
SAAAVAAATTGAEAADWSLEWGGFSTQAFGYADSDVDTLPDADFDGFDNLSDTEIIFRPSIVLENGVQFGAQVQLEGNTSGDQIDESFLFVDGAFGRVLLGSENSAGYLMTYAAPCVALTCHNSGSLTAFIPFSGNIGENAFGAVVTGQDIFRGTLGSTFLENQTNNDAQRITYFTPRLGGVQIGFSYARDALQDSSEQVNLAGEFGDFIDLGVNYLDSFGGVDVGVSARWGIAATQPEGFDSPTVYAFGATVSYAGVTIGGSFAEQNNSLRPVDVSDETPAGFRESDGQSFDVGIAYETGPWGFSLSYLNGRNSDEELIAGNGQVLGTEEADKFVAGINYALAQGVDLGIFGAYVDFDEEDAVADNAGFPVVIEGDDVDGFVLGTGIALNF